MAHRADEATTDGLGPRVLWGLVLAAAALALAYAGGFAFNLLVLVAAALMAYEWNLLCNGGATPTGATLAGATVAAAGMAAIGEPDLALIAVAPAAALAFAVAWATRLHRLWAAAGVVYIAVPCIAVIWLRAAPAVGLETIVWLLAVVWATDVGAYFAGRGIGGPKLAPRISPGKTWAGLVGGVVCAALVGAATTVLLELPSRAPLILLSALLAVVAQAGDLFESLVKRRFEAKDSGELIPGHGGVLDRLDGLLAAAPVVAVITVFSGQGVLAWR